MMMPVLMNFRTL